MGGAIEEGVFRILAPVRAEPVWYIPERLKLAKILAVTGLLTCSASAKNRYLKLSCFDKMSIKTMEFVSNTLLVANDVCRVTWIAGGAGSEISQDSTYFLGIGDAYLLGGDSIQIFGAHATDEISDAMLTVLAEPIV